jgi:magnesium-transporting ATPase (P-type)
LRTGTRHGYAINIYFTKHDYRGAKEKVIDTMQQTWHFTDAQTVVAQLSTNPATGLTPQEAEQRLAEYGPNELIDRGVKSVWKIYGSNLPMSWSCCSLSLLSFRPLSVKLKTPLSF